VRSRNVGGVFPTRRGKLCRKKVTACLKVLEDLEQQGLLHLPPKREMTRWSTDRASGAVPTQRTRPGPPLDGGLSEVRRVGLELVQDRDGKHLGNEYVDRYHALGYRQPMGCFLPYPDVWRE
jgi:hypothetical protein